MPIRKRRRPDANHDLPASACLDLPDALLDLRHLNESVAGEHGYVQLDSSGNGFADSQGRPP